MSSDLTSLMKKKYGVTRSSKVTFTANDTLFTKFRKLAKNIYKNGDWTEEDEMNAAKSIFRDFKLTGNLDETVEKINDDQIDETMMRMMNNNSTIYNAYQVKYRNSKNEERSEYVFLDKQNHSTKESGGRYYLRDTPDKYYHPYNQDIAVGYSKLVNDLTDAFSKSELLNNAADENKKYLQETFNLKMRLLTNSRYSTSKHKYNFMVLPPSRFYETRGESRIKDNAGNSIIKFIDSYINQTYDIVLQQEFEKDIDKATRAAAWQTKKNINQETLEVMNNSDLNMDFASLELDNDVDLQVFNQFEDEMKRIGPLLPKVNDGEVKPILRLRKLGNYKALGLFAPSNKTIAIDFRDGDDSDNGYSPGKSGIQSFIHEYGHFLDYSFKDENLSISPEFSKIVKDYQTNIQHLDKESYVSKKSDYYGTPTEIFARSFELYLSNHGFESAFIKDKDTYHDADEYRIFDTPMIEELNKYFDKEFEGLDRSIDHLKQLDYGNEEETEEISVESSIPAFTKDQLEIAASSNLVEYAEKNGVELIQKSRDSFTMKDHDSCIITPSKNMYYRFSTQTGGSIIDFAKEFVVDQSLNDKDKYKAAIHSIVDSDVSSFEATKSIKPRKEYEYDTSKLVDSFDNARKYLVNERGIDPVLVDELSKRNMVRENKYGSVVFPFVDPESKKVVGAFEQGTTIDREKYGKRGTFKRIQANSKSDFGFSFTFGQEKNLKFFESSIDALSYASLHLKDGEVKNTKFVSMDGLKPETVMNYVALHYKQTGQLPNSVQLCVDNDKAGTQFIEKLQKFQLNQDGKTVDLEANQPLFDKDWNEALKNRESNEKSLPVREFWSKFQNHKIKTGQMEPESMMMDFQDDNTLMNPGEQRNFINSMGNLVGIAKELKEANKLEVHQGLEL